MILKFVAVPVCVSSALADASSALKPAFSTLHAKIKVRDFDGQMIETTPGRIIFNQVVREAIATVN
jgi:hypothetical protein